MSILSFPKRGKWGKSSWRGNCSGYIYQEIFSWTRPQLFVDPMCGSGTSIEVAHELGIEAVGLDLHSGFNILRDSILDNVGRQADLVLSHPPYGGMIIYSGEVWGEAHPDDLSRCESDDDFHQKLQLALLNQREATKSGGVYGTILGDWRRGGTYTSYMAEAIARMPKEELMAVVIKAQHNVTSGNTTYRQKLPLIQHEYIVLWKKPTQLQVNVLSVLAKQQHKRLTDTWRVVVRLALMSLGGKSTLGQLYAKVAEAAPSRLEHNENWQAKVRQVLQMHSADFYAIERGIWAIA
ncbi:MAG: hypothetical protein Q7S87_19240 [Agitococcus sp.]|nr:hypothetical protein [Agitococcus sp.]